MHEHDHFHPPTSDDPYWTETCWFTFAVPERKLSGQLYPFFRPNQGVTSGGAFFWDDTSGDLHSCRYARNFWHLPLPEGADLADIELPNGIRYKCLEDLKRYELHYADPDDPEDLTVDLVFEGICPPNLLGGGHLDQPGRYTGTVVLGGEAIPVDAFGFRDRSWGPRSQFGSTLMGSGAPHGGYSYATASESDAFHAITMAFDGKTMMPIHGYLLRDGEYATLVPGKGAREVTQRDAAGVPVRVRITAEDELGRSLEAEGRCVNHLGVHLNPNLFTFNCLTEWEYGGVSSWGEDHDNWSATSIRHFFRSEVLGKPPLR